MKHFPLLGILILALFVHACKNDNASQAAAETQQPAPSGAEEAQARLDMANPYLSGVCGLLTDQEITKVFDVDLVADGAYTKDMKDNAACVRTWRKKDWREREARALKNPDLAISTENQVMVQVMDYKEGHLAIGYMRTLSPETYNKNVEGLGDEAKWSDDFVTLAVRKGPFRVNIKVDSDDDPAKNLVKAKELAAIVLPKVVNPAPAVAPKQ